MVDIKERYGARGDGVADDTVAIQKAIDEHLASTAVLFFPAGTYLVSDKLTWGDNLERAKFLVLQGAGRATTTIKLKDRAEGFADPAKPKPLMTMFEGGGTGMAFNTAIYDLTFDVGAGNPGAIGLVWMNNNQGTLRRVVIRSSDPHQAGAWGLALTAKEPGPGLVADVVIDGFDIGVRSWETCFSMMFERLTLRRQRIAGIDNEAQCLFFRHLASDNAVPAVRNRGPYGSVFLYDSTLDGGAADQPAILSENHRVVLRGVSRMGYRALVDCTVDGDRDCADQRVIGDWCARMPATFATTASATPATFNLPIEETPDPGWDAAAKWVVVDADTLDREHDDSVAIQAAIDRAAKEMKTTVCIPNRAGKGSVLIGRTVRIHGSVRRLIGMDGWFGVTALQNKKERPVFRVEDGDGPLVIERMFFTSWNTGRQNTKCWWIEHASKRPLVVRSAGFWEIPYRNSVRGGKVFIEDTTSSHWSFQGQQVWMRQYNPESNRVMTTVDGGTLWCFGTKTECETGVWFEAKNGAAVEILGGYTYPSWRHENSPPPPGLFRVDATSRLCASYREQSFQGYQQYPVQIEHGERRLGNEADAGGRFFPLVIAQPE